MEHWVSRLSSLLYLAFIHMNASQYPLQTTWWYCWSWECSIIYVIIYVTYAYAYSLMMRLKPFGLVGFGSLAILKSKTNNEVENKLLLLFLIIFPGWPQRAKRSSKTDEGPIKPHHFRKFSATVKLDLYSRVSWGMHAMPYLFICFFGRGRRGDSHSTYTSHSQ